MQNEKLDQLIKDQIKINQKIKELKAQKEKNKSEILVQLKTNNLEQYDDLEGNSAIINKYDRTSIDKEKVEKFCDDTGQDISYFQKTTPIEQLKVVEAKNEDNS